MDMMETFRQTYLEESFEGLDVMEAGLLELPPGTPDNEKINEIFRAAHSIKGGSGTFGFIEIAGFTHVLETLLDEMRDGQRDVTQESIDAMLAAVDVLRDMLTRLQDRQPIDETRANEVQATLERILGKEGEEGAVESETDSQNEPAEAASSGWHIKLIPEKALLQTGNEPLRIFRELETLGELSAKADWSALPAAEEFNPENLYIQWELTLSGDNIQEDDVKEVFEWIDGDGAEVIIEKPQAESQAKAVSEAEPIETEAASPQPTEEAAPKPEAAAKPAAKAPAKADQAGKSGGSPKQEGSIRVDLSKIDQLVNLVGELVITQSMLSQFGEQAEQDQGNDSAEWVDKLKEGLTHLERHTRELQESVMNIRMLPVSFAFNRMPRIVHDVSQKLGKQIDLVMEGENTELDKTMLEQLTDPLVHIVRNSIDHGVENPDVRAAAGKPEKGTVKLAAFHQGGNIMIQITDDGAGINPEKIEQKAIEKGVIEPDHGLSEQEIIDLIFHPGFSTADQVSDISGRGVGMDVVRRNINGLGGSVEVKTTLGEGSVFTIRLPLTLAILDGQLCSVGEETYVFPLVSIIESIQVDKSQVKGIAGKTELYKLRDTYIPVIRLHQKLGVEGACEDLTEGLLVVVEEGGKRAGIFVDDLLGQQQVVIKSLESNFMKIDGIAGATILGDGTVSLILDVKEAVSSTKAHNAAQQANAA